IFAQHNLMTDPPFTHLGMVSCRNMLIYLEQPLQQKIITTFHYALNPNGCLFLGSSESIGAAESLFKPLERSHKIFVKQPMVSFPRWQRPPFVPASRKVLPPSQPAKPSEFSVA